MFKRIRLAKELPNNDGVLYLCINDRKLSNLKLLCNKTLGAENYVNLIGVKTSTGGGNSRSQKMLRKDLEYVLIYSKSYINCKIKRLTISDNPIESFEYYHHDHVMLTSDKIKLVDSKNDKSICANIDYEIKTVTKVAK